MKKFLLLFLIIIIFGSSLVGFDSKTSSAETNTIEINPSIIELEPGSNPLNNPCDVSSLDNDFLILDQGSASPLPDSPHIFSFNSGRINLTDLQSLPLFVAGYQKKIYYSTKTKVFAYNVETKEHFEFPQNFTNILDLCVSDKNLFLIDNAKVFRLTENEFTEFLNYNEAIKKFAYSEVAKMSFAYNGTDIIIKGIDTNKFITESNVIDLICDFEGNLYVLKEKEIFKYDYINNYASLNVFAIEYNEITINNQIAAAAFIQTTGEILILCNDKLGITPVSNIYTISKTDIDSKISKDELDIPELNNLKIFDTKNKIDFYVAEITDYPSNRLYPANITFGGSLERIGEIEEIPVNEKVIVFKTSDKFSYVLYKNRPAIIYNNSLKKISEIEPAFKNGKILLNRSKVYLYPSNFVYEYDNKNYSFKTDELNKDLQVDIISEIEINGVTYFYIKYGTDKYGYINKAEVSEDLKIISENPKYGKIDSNGDVPLYLKKDTSSEIIITLKHKQKIEILESGNDFYYIKAEINDETYIGFVEAKFVLESGLTKLQKIGLWIFLSAIVLGIIAIILRRLITKKRPQ